MTNITVAPSEMGTSDPSLAITSRLLLNYSSTLAIAVNLLAADLERLGVERPISRVAQPVLGKDGFDENPQSVLGYQKELEILIALVHQLRTDAEFFSAL